MQNIPTYRDLLKDKFSKIMNEYPYEEYVKLDLLDCFVRGYLLHLQEVEQLEEEKEY